MNRPRHEFFACAGFAGDQDRRIAAGDLRHVRQDRGQCGRAADNLFEHRGLVDFLSKSHVFLFQSLFSSLAVFDISSGNIRTRNLPLFVVQGVVTSQKPAVSSIALAKPHFAFKSRAHRHSTIPLSLDPFRIIGMTYSANGGFVTPLIKSEAEVVKSTAVHEKTLAVASENSDELWCEVQNLPKLLFALAQRACEDLVLGDVDPGSDEPLEHSAVCRWRADAPDVTNRLVRTYDPLRKIESTMLRQHRQNFLRDEISVVRMHERHVFLDGRCFLRRIEAVNREQLRRPVFKARRGERPASRMREPLSLCQVELGFLAFVDVEVDPDPILHCSIGRLERLGTAEEPVVIPLSVPNSTTRLSGAARPQIVRPDSPHFFVIVRMQKGDMRVPRSARVGSEPKRMILWQA